MSFRRKPESTQFNLDVALRGDMTSVTGMSGLSYQSFGVLAYSGALIWSTTFVFLGKLVGEQGKTVSDKTQDNLLLAAAIAVFLIIAILVVRKMYRLR
jgi:membrane protein DedA with SNARE-associated domain